MDATQERIDSIVKGHDVVLFMKGTPLFPQCGFSSRASAILEHLDVPPGRQGREEGCPGRQGREEGCRSGRQGREEGCRSGRQRREERSAEEVIRRALLWESRPSGLLFYCPFA